MNFTLPIKCTVRDLGNGAQSVIPEQSARVLVVDVEACTVEMIVNGFNTNGTERSNWTGRVTVAYNEHELLKVLREITLIVH